MGGIAARTFNKTFNRQGLLGCGDFRYNFKNLERTTMAFKPNYNLQRSDRDRAARARNEEKQKKKDEKAAQRSAERAPQPVPPDSEKA
jgi:hypothetical protein